MSDARKYGTTNPVLIEARINHDPYDEFAWVQDWRFAIAEYLTHFRSTYVEGFRSVYTPGDTLAMMSESYAFEMLWGGNYSAKDLVYALKVLDRYREWLRIAGKDY
jgi:hypothetical protein